MALIGKDGGHRRIYGALDLWAEGGIATAGVGTAEPRGRKVSKGHDSPSGKCQEIGFDKCLLLHCLHFESWQINSEKKLNEQK